MPFTGGPSVRVTPNSKFEIRWIADFVGNGKVEIFDNANGGTAVDGGTTPAPSMEHTYQFTIGGVLKADTNYFFRITHSDPTGVRGDTTNDPAPYPPIFSGAQAIGDVFADVDVNSAVVSWKSNVIGLGRVDYGTASPSEFAATDAFNITDHSIALTGLLPGTTYQFRVSNRHAIDGDSLAEKTGSFTTKQGATNVTLTEPLARPRVIYPEDVATLSVMVRRQGAAVPGILVRFRALDSTAGGDALSDATGKATIWMQGGAPGLLRVEASSSDAGHRLVIPVVVRQS